MATMGEIVDTKKKEFAAQHAAQLDVGKIWAASVSEIIGRIVDELNDRNKKHASKLILTPAHVLASDLVAGQFEENHPVVVQVTLELFKTRQGKKKTTKQVAGFSALGTEYLDFETDAATGQTRASLKMNNEVEFSFYEYAMYKFMDKNPDIQGKFLDRQLKMFCVSADGENLIDAETKFRNAIGSSIALGNLKTLVS